MMMDAEEVDLRASRARRRVHWQEFKFGWWECLLKVKEMLNDSCWEVGQLEVICRKKFDKGELEMKKLVGIPVLEVEDPHDLVIPKFIGKRVEIAERGPHDGPPPLISRAMTPAEKQRAYRVRRKIQNKLGL